MKLNKLINVVPLAVLILAVGSGCRKSQFNINKNINNVTDSTVTYFVVMPAALNNTSRIVAGRWGPIQNWMSYWSRSGTYAPNVTEETYQITTGFGTAVWDQCYDNNYDYNIVRIKAATAGAGFYEGIARIMMAHNFQILVDVYGNVPYTQALKGSGNPTPAYDKGLDIYKALLREIDAGMLLINNATVTASNPNKDIATNDVMFQGDKTKWQKFGNTLKLRMLIHAYAVGAIDKTAEVAIINANGFGFLGVGENAMTNPGYTGNDKPNSFFNAYITNTDGSANANNTYYKANEWGIEYYKYNVDPRVTTYPSYIGTVGGRFYLAGSGGLIGVPYGTPPIATYSASVVAGIGPGLNKGATAPSLVMSSSESFFLQAEAKFRGWNVSASSPEALMNLGVSENMAYLGVPNAVANAAIYLSLNAPQPDAQYTAGPMFAGGPSGGLYTILSQKWFAMNGINTLETWTDWRRVPYSSVATKLSPALGNAAASTTNFTYGDVGFIGGAGSFGPGPFRSVAPQITPADQIPVRYLYPQTEYNYNSANVTAEGVITRYSRIFWDLN